MLLKLKLTPAIYLVGFMGCGKSTVGVALADELGWPFFDLDHEIEKHEGRSITSIFHEEGETAFRAVETAALRRRIISAGSGRPQVVALGGGVFTVTENCLLANQNGVTVWLDAPLHVMERRVAEETHRPLARDPQRLRELYYARRDAYQQTDYRIETGEGDTTSVVHQILKLPIFVP